MNMDEPNTAKRVVNNFDVQERKHMNTVEVAMA